MDSVIRALVVYVFLLAIFRISGKHSLGHITTFDLVLTLIISESIQQALVGTDNSMTNALLLVTTLVGANIVLSLAKQRWATAEKIIDGTTVLLMERGQLRHDRMDKERVDEANILGAAREQEGIERLDQIDYAVLEQGGGITVVRKRAAAV